MQRYEGNAPGTALRHRNVHGRGRGGRCVRRAAQTRRFGGGEDCCRRFRIPHRMRRRYRATLHGIACVQQAKWSGDDVQAGLTCDFSPALARSLSPPSPSQLQVSPLFNLQLPPPQDGEESGSGLQLNRSSSTSTLPSPDACFPAFPPLPRFLSSFLQRVRKTRKTRFRDLRDF